MPFGLLAIVVLSQLPEVKLASPGLTGVQVNKDVAAFYSDHFAQQLVLRGMSVVTTSEIQSLLGFERQKQLMGCSSDASSSCLAELANALGVDAIITGSIGKFDDVFQINIKVVSAGNARQLAAYSASVAREAAVLQKLTEAAEEMSPKIAAALGRAPTPPPAAVSTSTMSPRRKLSLIPAAVGIVSLAVGTVLMIEVGSIDRSLRGGDLPSTLSPKEAADAAFRGATLQAVGITLLAIGGAALAVAGVMFALGGSADTTVTALVTPRGDALVGVGGRW